MYVITQCNLFKVYIIDKIVEVEAANQGVTVREDSVSGLMFADDFVGKSETPEAVSYTHLTLPTIYPV